MGTLVKSDKYFSLINLIIFLIVFLVLTSVFTINVVAQTFTFTPIIDSAPVCPGTTGLFTDTLKNTGSTELSLTISTAGSASPWSTSFPIGVVLAPGDSKTIYTYVSPRTITTIGNYNIQVIANAAGEIQKLNHEVDVAQCYQYSINILDEKNLCPTDIDKYDVLITNNGRYSQTYSLKVDGQAASWVKLSEEVINLEPLESKTVFAFVTVPSTALGDNRFTIISTPQTSPNIQSATAVIKVNPCFDYDLATPENYVSFCEHTVQTIPVQIKNDGTITNKYSLTLDGPTWATLDSTRLEILPGESKAVNIVLTPDYGIEGDFNIIFTAFSDKGDAERIMNFVANVRKCNDVLLDVVQDSDRICNSLTNNYGVIVKNTGEVDKQFELTLGGPAWATLEKNLINLGAGQESAVNLIISPEFGTLAGTYDIAVKAEALDTSKVSSSDTISITTVTREECYQPKINLKQNQISIGYDSTATIPTIIENKGTLTANYDLIITGTAASFVEINPSVITVEPDKSEIVFVYIAPTFQTANGLYEATISARLPDSTILAAEELLIEVTESKFEVLEIPPEEVEKPNLFGRIRSYFLNFFTPPVQEEIIEVPEEQVTEIEEEVLEEEVVEEEIIEEEVIEEEIEEVIEIEELGEVNLDVDAETTQLMDLNDRFTFTLNQEIHTATLQDASETTIVLIIESTPFYVALDSGDTKQVDVDNNGAYDLRITFNGFKDGQADITYEKLTEEAAKEEEIIEPETKAAPALPNIREFLVNYRNYIAAGIIILIIIILLVGTKARKKIMDFFEEEIEEEPKKKK